MSGFSFNLISGLSTYWNIAAPLIPQNLSASHIRKKVEQVAEAVAISHRLKFKINTLSGGEMQRVAIARALISDPEILIPTNRTHIIIFRNNPRKRSSFKIDPVDP